LASASAAVITSPCGTTRFDQAPVEGGRGVDRLAGERYLGGPLDRDLPLQPDQSAGGGEQSTPHLRQPEPRLIGGDHQVARERELGAATERVPVDRGHHRLVHPVPREPREAPVVVPSAPIHSPAASALRSAPAQKARAGSGEHQHPDRGVARGSLDPFAQRGRTAPR
jgi:hypothetical protein